MMVTTISDEACDELFKKHTWWNGAHPMTDHRALIREVIELIQPVFFTRNLPLVYTPPDPLEWDEIA